MRKGTFLNNGAYKVAWAGILSSVRIWPAFPDPPPVGISLRAGSTEISKKRTDARFFWSFIEFRLFHGDGM